MEVENLSRPVIGVVSVPVEEQEEEERAEQRETPSGTKGAKRLEQTLDQIHQLGKSSRSQSWTRWSEHTRKLATNKWSKRVDCVGCVETSLASPLIFLRYRRTPLRCGEVLCRAIMEFTASLCGL